MITIHNNIERNIKVNIYHNGEYIGTCENELAFLDVQVQIAQQKLTGMQYSYNGIRYNIDKNGTIEPGAEIPWTGHVDKLVELITAQAID